MKKILFIIPYVPYPLNSGGNQAFFNMVEYIKEKMSVSILLYPKTGQDLINIEELKKVWTNVHFFVFKLDAPQFRNSLYISVLQKIKASATRKIRRHLIKQENDPIREKSLLSQSYYPELPSQYLDYVAKISRSGFDIIQVEFFELISLGYILPPDTESVFVHHEIRYIRNENEMALFNNLTEREKMYFQLAKDYERAALLQYKHVIALTETDKNILKQLTNKESIYSSPAIVRLSENNIFQPITTNRLTFLGSGGHYPNNDAMKWFASEIIPILRKKNFHFTLEVIGSWNLKEAKTMENASEIEMTGFVPNLHQYLNRSISIIPVRIGSGMRMKALDAIAAQAPIISTSKGIEGIDLRHNEECLIADSPEKFAEEIIRLSQDVNLQKKLSSQAYNRLKQLYKPEEMLKRRMDIYNQIMQH